MDLSHLESWVKEQYKEIGFRNGGKGALKQQLISRYPEHEQGIRQLVNAQANPVTYYKISS